MNALNCASTGSPSVPSAWRTVRVVCVMCPLPSKRRLYCSSGLEPVGSSGVREVRRLCLESYEYVQVWLVDRSVTAVRSAPE